MKHSEKKNLEKISNEQLSRMFSPVPDREMDFIERRKQLGTIFAILFGIGLVIYFLFT